MKLEDLRLLQRRKPINRERNPTDGRSTYSNRSANITRNAMHQQSLRERRHTMTHTTTWKAREKKLLGGTQTDESEGSKCPCKKEGTLGGGNNMRCTE
jgi:hypothetical protein